MKEEKRREEKLRTKEVPQVSSKAKILMKYDPETH
jgi:hypothetical protein